MRVLCPRLPFFFLTNLPPSVKISIAKAFGGTTMKFDRKVVDSHWHIYPWFDENGEDF